MHVLLIISDFYLKWTCQRNTIKAVDISSSAKAIPLFLLERPFSGPTNCMVASLTPTKHLPRERMLLFIMCWALVCFTTPSPFMVYCSQTSLSQTGTQTKRNTSRALGLCSSSLPWVPPAFQSCSSLAEPLGKKCDANRCHWPVGVVLKHNDSWTCCIIGGNSHGRLKPYDSPVISLPFYNLVPSGARHRQSLNQKAVCSIC